MTDTHRREPRSTRYDGAAYARLIDPLLSRLHAIIARQVSGAERVLDACCGTGAMAARLADGGSDVVGIDLSPKNIAYAEQHRGGIGRLRFETADVAHLEHHSDGAFDVATIVLALHEMPPRFREPVLREVGRVARRVILVDYAVPMPKNFAGIRNRVIEWIAGGEHHAGFRDFLRHGGLPPLVDRCGLEVATVRPLDAGTMTLLTTVADQPRDA